MEYCLIEQLKGTRYASSGGSMDVVYGLRVDITRLNDAPLGDALLALYREAGLKPTVLAVMTRPSYLGALTEVLLHRHGDLVGPFYPDPPEEPHVVPEPKIDIPLPPSEYFGFPAGMQGWPAPTPPK